jgi:hypothetical protein
MCPNCETGKLALLEVWHEDFVFHLVALLTPFLVVAWVCLMLELGGERPRSAFRPVSQQRARQPLVRPPTTRRAQ